MLKKVFFFIFIIFSFQLGYSQLSNIKSADDINKANEEKTKKKKDKQKRRRLSYEEEFDNIFKENNVSLVATRGTRSSRSRRRIKKKDLKVYFGMEAGVGFFLYDDFKLFDITTEQEETTLSLFSNNFFPVKVYVEFIPQKTRKVVKNSFSIGYSLVFRNSQSFIPQSPFDTENYIFNANYTTKSGMSHILSFHYDFSYKTLFLSGFDIMKLYAGISANAMLSQFEQSIAYVSSPKIANALNPLIHTDNVTRKYPMVLSYGGGVRTGVKFRATPKITLDLGISGQYYLSPGDIEFEANVTPELEGFQNFPLLDATSIKILPSIIIQPYFGVKYSP